MIFKSPLSTMLVCGNLLISLISTASAQDCADSTGKFRPKGVSTGKKMTCTDYSKMDDMCSDEKVKEKCCVSCPDTNTSPTSSPPVCSDIIGKFSLNVDESSDRTKRKCLAWSKQKGCIHQTVLDNCCASCKGTPTPPAPTSATGPTPIAPTPNPNLKDLPGKFKLGKKSWTCKKIRNLNENKKKRLCRKSKAKKKCLKTCAPGAPITSAPTSSPTDQPTSSPSSSPTSSPSSSPTSSPSSSPTSSPSSSPISTSPQCTITSNVTFPPIQELRDAGYFGYSESSLRVINNDMDEICSESHDETFKWNCVHRSDSGYGGNPTSYAHVYVMEEDDYTEEGSETAVIQHAAGAKYTFFMGHKFSKYENDYYKYGHDEDHMIKSYLTVSVGNTMLGQFASQNDGANTHVLDIANPLYDDSLILDVECDDNCKCTAAVRSDTCRIRAEISHPDITSLFEGYHADTVSVGRKDDYDACSKSSTETKWCEHEGDAEYYYEPYYEDNYSTTESIVIPDAADGEYLFKVNYDIPDGYEDDLGDPNQLNGKLTLHFETHNEVTEYSHMIDGVHYDTFYLAVSCKDRCVCEVVQKATLDDETCTIKGKLEFPGKAKVKYFGYHNDYFVIEKEGAYNDCSDYYTETSWGCKHNGDAYVHKTELDFDKKAEFFTITDIVDKSFRVTIKHWFDEGKENIYPNDHKLFAKMALKLGDGDYTGSYRKPDNNYTDTHILNDDGDVIENPEFKDETYVDISCNEFCACDVKQYDPVCQVDAELSFPEFKGNASFYNEESVVAVNRAYPDDKCEYQKLSNWGCISYGDAYIHKPLTIGEDYNETQILKIPDASNSDLTFTVTHSYLEISNTKEYNPKDASILDVRVNGETIKKFLHKKIKSKMFQGGAVVVDGYESEMSVKVSCDENCVCTASEITP